MGATSLTVAKEFAFCVDAWTMSLRQLLSAIIVAVIKRGSIVTALHCSLM